MLDFDMDEMAEKTGGVFALCALIKRRTHQLVRGAQPLVENVKGKEAYEIALDEIDQGKVKFQQNPYHAFAGLEKATEETAATQTVATTTATATEEAPAASETTEA